MFPRERLQTSYGGHQMFPWVSGLLVCCVSQIHGLSARKGNHLLCDTNLYFTQQIKYQNIRSKEVLHHSKALPQKYVDAQSTVNYS